MDMKFDRFAAVAFLAVGVLFMIGSRNLSSSSYGSSVGPDIFPFVLGLVLAALSIRLFYEAYQSKRQESSKEKLEYKPFIIILLSTLIYILTLETFGYVITTFLFLFVCFQTMERSKWVTSLIISAGFSGIVYFLFVNVLKGTLPGWPIWFS
ncbi:tripartite tricarboxylate transporter TctB family protein [Peribacillus sp. TH16]|uniref:tripartite tricarboxylate transporter TctB family protein n=2 Tax=Peribacillus TaxID=2675229 RepID=UPI001913F216|nr:MULTISPECIES: tripartite tricarboxylate transporter TctB family protein [unclassified Peribacillus]MBK5443889.1 tripartite tricarboxylate transporter TctB family protein [Peribacillus sp. TH24]MBK5485289.1 tripartite tricarboxylate transporter TctB family protein [Peribacillus sp. TH16]WMX55381.1 tripartite tricarboxylate transporter TctB family protein [Peribacillus sp. R9-11]